jgi:hypothetical protein
LAAPIGRTAASLTNRRSGPTDLIDTEQIDLNEQVLIEQVLIDPVQIDPVQIEPVLIGQDQIDPVLEGLLATVLAQIGAVPVKHVLREHVQREQVLREQVLREQVLNAEVWIAEVSQELIKILNQPPIATQAPRLTIWFGAATRPWQP